MVTEAATRVQTDVVIVTMGINLTLCHIPSLVEVGLHGNRLVAHHDNRLTGLHSNREAEVETMRLAHQSHHVPTTPTLLRANTMEQ